MSSERDNLKFWAIQATIFMFGIGILSIVLGVYKYVWLDEGRSQGRAEQEAKDKANAPKAVVDHQMLFSDTVIYPDGRVVYCESGTIPDTFTVASKGCDEIAPGKAHKTSPMVGDGIYIDGKKAYMPPEPKPDRSLIFSGSTKDGVDYCEPGYSCGCTDTSCQEFEVRKTPPMKQPAPKRPLKCTDEYGVVYNCADGRTIHPTDDTLPCTKEQLESPYDTGCAVFPAPQGIGGFDNCHGHLDPIGPYPKEGDDVDMDPVNCTIRVRVPKAEDQ